MIETKVVQDFLDTISSKYPQLLSHFPIIQQACDFALHAHAWQKRKYSGWPYIEHPINVALMWVERFGDVDLIVASILHDCVEDNKALHIENIYKLFWPKVWFIVDSVTDTTNHFFSDPTHVFNDRIEKILYGGMQDIRCILLKLHDRENNIGTLSGLEPRKQIRMSFETQAIYAPLKKLFGLDNKNHQTIFFCDELLHHYLSANKITTAEEFKKTLLSQTFFDFDNDTFDLVYNNTNSIYREIKNKSVFENLVDSKCFDEKIEVISLQQTVDGKFLAIFKYKQWNVFEDLNSDISIHTNFS